MGVALMLVGSPAAGEDYPSWSWGGSVSSLAGYDDNITISPLVRFGDKRGSGTTELSGRIGPELQLTERLSTALAYGFDHTFYFADSDLDLQRHTVRLTGTLSHDRVEASLGYRFGLSALLPKGTLYSLDHQPSLSVEVLLRKPLWLGLDYTFHYYDVRDASYAYLGGQRHTIEAYPEIYLARKLTLYAGYRLDLLRIGSTVDEVVGAGGGAVEVTSPQSYNAHYFFLYARWRPVASLALILGGRVGQRIYTEPISGATSGRSTASGGGSGAGQGPGPGGSAVSRADTVLTVEPGISWKFWKGLSLKASFYYERSWSSVSTRRVLASSYDNLAGSGGIAWEF
jgi:hypothetical protein